MKRRVPAELPGNVTQIALSPHANLAVRTSTLEPSSSSLVVPPGRVRARQLWLVPRVSWCKTLGLHLQNVPVVALRWWRCAGIQLGDLVLLRLGFPGLPQIGAWACASLWLQKATTTNKILAQPMLQHAAG